MLDGVFFTTVLETPAYTIATHEKAIDYYSNLAGNIRCQKDDLPTILNKLENYFADRNRPATIYVTPFTQPSSLNSQLKNRGFQPAYKDAWMYFSESPKLSPKTGAVIKTVNDRKQMRLFVDVFNQAYGGTDPREPYGQAPPEWGETLSAAFGLQKNARQVDFYMLYDNGEPASVLLTSRIDGFGGIYSIGTIPKMRGRGHAASLTLHAVQQLQAQGASTIFLQTEKDSYNEHFYTKLGFSTEWVAEVWSVSSVVSL